MTRIDVQALIDYNYWARDRLLEAVAQLSQEQLMRDLGSSFRSVRDTLTHLHGASGSGIAATIAVRSRRCCGNWERRRPRRWI